MDIIEFDCFDNVVHKGWVCTLGIVWKSLMLNEENKLKNMLEILWGFLFCLKIVCF